MANEEKKASQPTQPEEPLIRSMPFFKEHQRQKIQAEPLIRDTLITKGETVEPIIRDMVEVKAHAEKTVQNNQKQNK